MKKALLISVFVFFVPFYCMAVEPGCGDVDDGESYNSNNSEENYGDDESKPHPTIGASGYIWYNDDVHKGYYGKYNEGAKYSSDWELSGRVIIAFENWQQPAQSIICYVASSSARTRGGGRGVDVQRVSVRLYNWAVDSRDVQTEWSSAMTKVCLKPGTNRPWIANSVHSATRNGVTLRTSLSVSR